MAHKTLLTSVNSDSTLCHAEYFVFNYYAVI